MALSLKTKNEIINLLIKTVKDKLKEYKPETIYAPFQHNLLGKDKYAMFSFVQSMNTTFGMSIWEQIAVILAKGAGYSADRQYKLLGEIDNNTDAFIRDTHHKLREGKITVNKEEEIEHIKKIIKKGKANKDPDSTVDLFVNIKGVENYFDITSVKPNIKEFVALKLKLLRWLALRLSQDNNANIFTRLAIPYNPYYPEPYERWTLKGLYDLDNGEILVGEEFWNFVAGDNIYEKLIDIFRDAGEKLRPEIDKKFSEFRKL